VPGSGLVMFDNLMVVGFLLILRNLVAERAFGESQFLLLLRSSEPRHPSRTELDYCVQVLCIKELLELVRI
jgi:hypothetical protein